MTAAHEPKRDRPLELEPEPDVRFSLANERTLLAWSRTALAFIGAGVAVAHLLPDTTLPGARRVLAVFPIVFGAVLAGLSYGRWAAVEAAMREGRPLPGSVLPRILTVAIVLSAAAGVVIALSGSE